MAVRPTLDREAEGSIPSTPAISCRVGSTQRGDAVDDPRGASRKLRRDAAGSGSVQSEPRLWCTTAWPNPL